VARPKGSKNKPKNVKDKSLIETAAKALKISFEDAESLYKRPIALQEEAEAVLSYVYDRDGWLIKTCKNCGHEFAANYKYISFCSNPCRQSAMDAIGLGWNPERSEDERWEAIGIEKPGIVPPEALEALKILATKFAKIEAALDS
jgi:hypothetical protein